MTADLIVQGFRRLTENRADIDSVLRSEQRNVIDDFRAYLEKRIAINSGEPAMARIVLPPRTGKTVVASLIVKATGFSSLFLVPTKALVDQAVQEFRRFIPEASIGVLFGDAFEPRRDGINIATYAMAMRLWKGGQLEERIGCPNLVFADEGHHAMSVKRLRFVRDGFSASTLRIALTATPDYDEERILARYYPDLIHEITIQEGVELGLLAKANACAFELDIDASQVRVIGSEYDQTALTRVLTRQAFLDAAGLIRYSAEYATIPCLVCCASRAQAERVTEALAAARPSGFPEPAIIHQDTPRALRRKLLTSFEAGTIDTLVNIGVLVEGWDSPRCKLLIDLSPSPSIVRSAQKYARAMTLYEGREATIVVLIPRKLRRSPVLPADVFGPGIMSVEETDSRAGDASSGGGGYDSLWQQFQKLDVEIRRVYSLKLIDRCRVDRFPRNIQDREAVTELFLRTGLYPPTIDLPAFARFRWIRFEADGASLNGGQLLRVLGFEANLKGYQDFIARFYPDVYADRLLLRYRGDEGMREILEDLAARYRQEPALSDSEFTAEHAEEAMSQGSKDMAGNLYERLSHAQEEYYVRQLAEIVAETPVEQLVIEGRLLNEEQTSLKEVGDMFGRGGERARQIEQEALAHIRRIYGTPLHELIEPRKSEWIHDTFMMDIPESTKFVHANNGELMYFVGSGTEARAMLGSRDIGPALDYRWTPKGPFIRRRDANGHAIEWNGTRIDRITGTWGYRLRYGVPLLACSRAGITAILHGHALIPVQFPFGGVEFDAGPTWAYVIRRRGKLNVLEAVDAEGQPLMRHEVGGLCLGSGLCDASWLYISNGQSIAELRILEGDRETVLKSAQKPRIVQSEDSCFIQWIDQRGRKLVNEGSRTLFEIPESYELIRADRQSDGNTALVFRGDSGRKCAIVHAGRWRYLSDSRVHGARMSMTACLVNGDAVLTSWKTRDKQLSTRKCQIDWFETDGGSVRTARSNLYHRINNLEALPGERFRFIGVDIRNRNLYRIEYP